MPQERKPLDLTIIGAGMIVNDLILPAAMQCRREGWVGEITVVGQRASSQKALRENAELAAAFPGETFTALPDPDGEDSRDPELYKKVLAEKDPYNLVIVALPDDMHFRTVMDVLSFNQHVLCVKPLVLKYEEARIIEEEARRRRCFVGVEYHKRFDRRNLLARKHYRNGDLGEFVLGQARLMEPYYYRHSNFQNWFTCDKTDPFVYVGCHYVDLVCFITGLKPCEVSVNGRPGKFPNGNTGYMWTDARVIFENGALLSVVNGLGYPDDAGGGNDQGITMFFEGDDCSGILAHDDQFRGVEGLFVRNQAKRFQYENPDFNRFLPYEGEGLKPVGYGVESIVATASTVSRMEAEAAADPARSAEIRLANIDRVNDHGIIVTPANARYNELVQEAARLSLANNGDYAVIDWSGEEPRVRLRHENF